MTNPPQRPDEQGQPVAWLYVRPDGWTTIERNHQPDWAAWGWTETPLYAHPQDTAEPCLEAQYISYQMLHEAAIKMGYPSAIDALEDLAERRAHPTSGDARNAALEEAARLVEKRRDERFADHGTTEPDTNASYYSGRYGETFEALDEEDEEIAAAIRALTSVPLSDAGRGWQPIETAVAIGGSEDGGLPVLVCHAGSGRQLVGVIRDFTGDDGVIRRGIGIGMGVFIATHWMPLPTSPDQSPLGGEGE